MLISVISPKKIPVLIRMTVIISALIIIGIITIPWYISIKTISELLTENKRLKEALTRLTQEDQIGYAKVVKQEQKDGRLKTTLKFVETARDDKTEKILEKEYIIEGDIVHFDAVIVKFGSQVVVDGKERSLYLWRRVHGENMSPSAGYEIDAAGREPVRYKGLLEKLDLQEQNIFWSGIWDLANDPHKLKKFGVQAIYGNAVYSQLKPGLIYVFKISNTGQFYPETIPEM